MRTPAGSPRSCPYGAGQRTKTASPWSATKVGSSRGTGWRSTKGGAAVALGSAIAPRTEDITCIWIEDVDVVSPDELVAALPRERQYLAGACEIVGSDVELPWELVGDTSRTVVVIDDERWAPFPLGDEDVVWLRCDRDQLECARIEPALTSSWSEPAGSSSGR